MSDSDQVRGFQGVWIPAGLWNNPELSWMEKCLVAEIDSLSSAEHGPCNASCEFLAERMKSTSGAMREMLSQLMKKGIIWQLGFDGRKAWRCVAAQFSSNQSKYQEWAKDPKLSLPPDSRCQLQLTAGVSYSSQQVSAHADIEIPVEIPVEILKERERKKREKKVRAISEKPKKEEVSFFVTSLGLTNEDADEIWDNWLTNGFRTKTGPIRDWQACCRNWQRNGWFHSQKQCNSNGHWNGNNATRHTLPPGFQLR